MRFGLFGSAEAKRGASGDERTRGYRAFVDMQVEAEALGYHVTFVTEHHFGGIGQVSDTLGLLSWVAAATRTLRVGTAVIVLPWHDPILLAERAATLDLLSGGRLDLGIGRGYRHTEFEGFMMPIEEAQARFDEARALMIRAWTSNERFSHAGRFWRYKDIIVEPPAVQEPHPPLWIAAGNPESIATAAALGCNLLLDQFASPAAIGERIALYKSKVEASGRIFDPGSVAVARNIFVAENAAELEVALERQRKMHANMVRLSARPDRQNRSHIMRYTDQPGGTEAYSIYGSPEYVIEQINALRAVGVNTILVSGGSQSRLTFQRIAQRVMPSFS